MKRIIPALAATLACSAYAGEATVARLQNVSGSVLVSDASSIASAGESLRLAPGMRVLTTANARVTIAYDDGCRVLLAPGQRFEIRAAGPCPSHGAYIQTIASAAGARKP